MRVCPPHGIRSLLVAAPLLLLPASDLLAAGPNFLFINIDDLGYADIGPFGSKINRTPNLDRMAKEGRKLTSFYAAPVCSPSRAALLTGCYPKRVLPIPHVLFPGNAVGLSPSEVTLAEVLKAQGYATAIVGKWHLGDQPEFLPNRQGFDLHFGLPYSNDMGPAEDGVKSDLGKPLPKTKGTPQPPLPLLRNGTVLQRVRPDDQQTLLAALHGRGLAVPRGEQVPAVLPVFAPNAVHFPIYPGKKWAGKSPHGLFSDWVEEVDGSVGQSPRRRSQGGPGRADPGDLHQRQRRDAAERQRAPARPQGQHVGGRRARADHRLVAGESPGRHRNQRHPRNVRHPADVHGAGGRQVAGGPETRWREHLAAADGSPRTRNRRTKPSIITAASAWRPSATATGNCRSPNRARSQTRTPRLSSSGSITSRPISGKRRTLPPRIPKSSASWKCSSRP